jgi:hypothetical protein
MGEILCTYSAKTRRVPVKTCGLNRFRVEDFSRLANRLVGSIGCIILYSSRHFPQEKPKKNKDKAPPSRLEHSIEFGSDVSTIKASQKTCGTLAKPASVDS